METGFQLFPDAASTIAPRVDALYRFLVWVSVFFALLICVLILYFGVRFRRGSPAPRENPPQSIWLEVTWSVIPLVVTMVMFGGGAAVYHEMRQIPVDVPAVTVVGKQWMWKLQHPEGRAEINELHVPVGVDMRLRMISEDVIHSFYIPAFRVKQDVLPGYYTEMWFQATKPGRYHLFCAEYCGTEHAQMRGTVVVLPPDEFAEWLAGERGEPPDVAGRRLFERHRCGTCHKPEGGGTAPSLIGLYGRQVVLQDGRTATADEQYLRDSILDPQRQIVAGYQPLMPLFDLNESDVLRLIAYLKAQQGAPGREETP